MRLRAQVRSALPWAAVNQFGSQLVQLCVMAILARNVPHEFFGLLALTNVICAFLLIFAKKGFDDAIIQRRSLSDETLDSAFWVSAVMGGVLTLIGCAISPIAAYFFDEPRLVLVLCALSFSMFFGAVAAVPLARLRRDLDLKPVAIRQIVGRAIGGVFGIALAFMNADVWALVANQLIGEAASTAILWKYSDYRPKLRFAWKEARELLSFGMHIIGTQILNFLNRRYDVLIIGKFFGIEVLGYYAIAMRLIDTAVDICLGMYARVGYPLMCALAGNMPRFREVIASIFSVVGIILVPVAMSMVLFADVWVLLLFGPQWADAVPILSLLAPLLLFKIPSWAQSHAIVSVGRVRERLFLALFFGFVSVAGLTISAFLGLHWFTLVATLRYVAICSVTVWVFARVTGIPVRGTLISFSLPIVIGYCAFGGTNLLATQLDITSYVMRIPFLAGGCVIYAISIWIVRGRELMKGMAMLRRDPKAKANRTAIQEKTV